MQQPLPSAENTADSTVSQDDRRHDGATGRRLIVLLAFLVGLIALVPWQPEMFQAELDSSWRIMSNVWFESGARF
jgi:hypothetical protein